MKSQQTNIKDLGTILGVWAHPDDETWACAGLMIEAIANGQKVACVMATKGTAGRTADPKRWPAKHLASIRETEMGQALSIIGVHDFYWLTYRDGQLAETDKAKAVNRLLKIINEVKPDTIITFEPTGITGHTDHKAVCDWTCSAVKKAKHRPVVYGACETTERYDKVGRECNDKFNIYFNTDVPFTIAEKSGDLVFKLSRSQARQKMAALRAHESQTADFFKTPIGKKYLKKLCSVECFVKLD